MTPAPVDESLLDVPPVGQGFQMQTEETEVPAGVEQQDCYFFKVSELAASNGMDPTAPREPPPRADRAARRARTT